MKKNYQFLVSFIFAFLTFTGFAQGSYDDGIFVLNEGMFGTNTASVSYLSNAGVLTNDIYAAVNIGSTIGQLAQDMGFYGDNAYIISGGTGEVVVVNRTTFAHITTVSTGFSNPRYIVFDDGMAYITDWGDPVDPNDDYVAVLNLETNTVIRSISVVEGPENIVKKNNQLFVAHQGGYGQGNSVSVINIADDSVSQLAVGDVPNSISADDDYLYVLCGGTPAWTGSETIGQLYRIDLEDFSTMNTYDFTLGEHPNYMQLGAGTVYYVLNNNIYSFDFSATLPSTEFINTAAQNINIAYGLSLIDEVLYLSDAGDYVSSGQVAAYNISGALQNTYTVGLIPNGVYKYTMELGIYAPPVGQEGTTAIESSSTLFVDWASGATITRGLVNISDPSVTYNGDNYASVGSETSPIGAANSSVVSLGDAGEAILTFDTPIRDGSGYDFAVFENGFSDTFLELAFVEISSDGVNFFRFPAHSQTPTDTQVPGFGSVDATYINNLAGKYRSGFGTPFDISDIADNAMLDKNAITHVKVIDVVGTIMPEYASVDSYGNMVNDPFPTAFNSGGFDLNAVGVINQASLSVNAEAIADLKMYPNPASNVFNIQSNIQIMDVEIYSVTGKLVKQFKNSAKKSFNISNLKPGMYLVKITTGTKNGLYKLIKQ
ncbi:DUF5074 domain-containing protein [Bizionia sp. KMM 8389]